MSDSGHSHDIISIHGARQNNLRNLDLDIAIGSLTVVTGPSGSGKSSLAFDTLYAEGQRRYVETFSPYARQFLDRCDRPKVDRIDGIPPAIAINQSGTVKTSRSTVGTMTELNDHIKLLFAREAGLFCRDCGRPVRALSSAQMWDDIRQRAALCGDPRLVITFDLSVPDSLDRQLVEQNLSAQGFTRVHCERKAQGSSILSVVIDRFRAARTDRSRGVEAVEKALAAGQGPYKSRFCVHALQDEGKELEWFYAEGLVCAHCNLSYAAPTPSRFSFNSAVGACENCRGFGRVIGIDLGLIIPDESLSLADGCIKPWQGTGASSDCQRDLLRCAKRDRIRLQVPFSQLSAEEKNWVIYGEPGWSGHWSKQWYGIANYFSYLETKAYKLPVRVLLSRYRTYSTCPVCQGARLKPEGLFWRLGSLQTAQQTLTQEQGHYRRFHPACLRSIDHLIDGLPGLTVHDLMLLPIDRLALFFSLLRKEISDEPGLLVVDEITTRLRYLIDVGVGYLTLERQSRTLSGGEVQRVNLTTALGTRLVSTLFVLDEPSVGLHPRDMDRVNAIMGGLRNAGNTLVVVEHDPQVMLTADRIIDMGPGAGEKGGTIVYDGPAQDIRSAGSLTGLYLSGRLQVGAHLAQISPERFVHWLEIFGAREHNLKSVDVRFPLNTLTAVTGVSGSGKSTLISDVLVPAVQRSLGVAASAGAFSSIEGTQWISEVLWVDQSSIGKTTRSNPVVYVGAFTAIRTLFAGSPVAQERGYSAGSFSFNSGEGRCPTCQGAGFERIEMQFLSDVYLRCPDCNGRRYRPDVLEVTLTVPGKMPVSIADVLDMTVSEALAYFEPFREIVRRLQPLSDVGLSYVKLGQPVSSLSGGEAQRLKLAGILGESTRPSGTLPRLYVFDEPTTGLHFDDIAKLLTALRRLIQAGHSVILVEHNLDVINASDWIIDLGPEGGDAGGTVVATGTPDALCRHRSSYTGRALAAYRRTLTEPGYSMTGLFAAPPAPAPSAGRSLQSVWKKARTGDMGIFGAREHNLKNIDVVIPRNQLTAVTGVSGSGKSSLAFGIIFSEGQRRYLESLNAYARSIVQPGQKADVERVVGIAPTVAIEQRTSRGGRKSTVATLTEIQHFLRLIYVRLGVQYCPRCHVAVTPQSFETIVAAVLREEKGKYVTITAPLVTERKGIYTDIAKRAQALGADRLRVDGRWVDCTPFPKLSRYAAHSIELPLATVLVQPHNEQQLRTALGEALLHGHGLLNLLWGSLALGHEQDQDEPGQKSYSTKRACPVCSTSFPEPDPRLFSYNSKLGWCPTCFGTGRVIEGFDAEQSGEESAWNDTADSEALCPDCQGLRLNAVARNVLFEDLSICDVTALSVDDCLKRLGGIHLLGRARSIGEDPLKEILSRLRFLQEVGLGYLSLDRDAPSLSGGEAQRIRLAAQLGSNLQGVCYVLDEPTIGLHTRDNTKLIASLIALKDKGNTVVVVEHDEQTIRQADHIVDIGPGAGEFGGELVAQGSIDVIENTPASVTGRLLARPMVHTGTPKRPVTESGPWMTVSGACFHNLKNLTVKLPLGHFIALSGVSGSGKSTLARDVLLRTLTAFLSLKKGDIPSPVGCRSVTGLEYISRVLEVDQSPIGKTSRSCPATYVGFFNPIRDLFAATNQAQERGYSASRFSFNTALGRCPVCEGQGEVTVEMNFLPDVKVVCETCSGKRFDEETLSVLWQNHSIGDILSLSVDEAVALFASSPRIAHPLQLLQQVGLGYLRLGQPSSTLSGGEAQRIKLVTELSKAAPARSRGASRATHTFYILDEPTVGLHMADVEKLVAVLHRLVDAGNTVLVIEHNLDVIAEADYVVDLGPEGGPDGGEVVAQGSPAEVARLHSATATALAQFFSQHKG